MLAALRLESTLASWGIAMTVWYCGTDAAKLARCDARKIAPPQVNSK
ncbi:MAG: hypothetical protein KIS96_11735 [Bauldia sp.]|nr:hypothetical protein [Bauldia sp.]